KMPIEFSGTHTPDSRESEHIGVGIWPQNVPLCGIDQGPCALRRLSDSEGVVVASMWLRLSLDGYYLRSSWLAQYRSALSDETLAHRERNPLLRHRRHGDTPAISGERRISTQG